MQETTKTTSPTTSRDHWFNEFIGGIIHDIRVDEMALKTKTASAEKVKMYDTLMSGDTNKLFELNRDIISRHFAAKITLAYLKELFTSLQDSMPLVLAMRLTTSKILVWAVVKDGDDKTEDTIILTEAKINALFKDNGIHISSTIVEESDNLLLPPHYTDILDLVKGT